MARKFAHLIPLITLLVVVVPWAHHPRSTMAQENVQALAKYALTIYSEADRASPIVGVLAPQAKVVLEARNADTSWVLGRSIDGMVRGWMESRYLALTPDLNIPQLLYSNEAMFVQNTTSETTRYDMISLDDYPIIPTSTGLARTIFEQSRAYTRNPHTISKIGDCISDNQHFLSPFGLDQYTLGSYGSLQPVIDHFRESLAYSSLAAYDGLVTSAVLDPLFANPMACLPGETPLRCEYRVHQPSVAMIMFGAQDLLFTSPEDFDRNLRHIVHETIQAGVVPILSTFPGNLERWQQSIQYNQIVVAVALDYDIPLMNLWRALYALPNYGLNDDGRHLSLPITQSGDLTPDNLQRGYPMRNLVTLQTLDVVWRGAMN